MLPSRDFESRASANSTTPAGNNRFSIANFPLKVKRKRELTEQIEVAVARGTGVMLVLPITAQGLLVIHLAGGVIDAFAREEQNEKNGDDDKRHKRRGFLSIQKNARRISFFGSRSDYSMFLRQKKACNSISFNRLFCAGRQFSQS